MQATVALGALNFALAGAREGFGPFLGVYLQDRGYDPAVTGFAMGLAGLAGLVATTPVGALIDGIVAKRAALALAVAGISLGAVILVATNRLWLVAVAQLLIGVADTSVAPLVAAVTLGLVGQAAYARQVSQNEVFNHAGNAANAALSGLFGYYLGLSYVAVAIVVMTVATWSVLLGIDARAIDHEVARGGEADGRSTWRVLVETRPLIVLALSVFALEAADGAILPFLAQAQTKGGANPSLVTGVMVVGVQLVSVPAALLANRFSRGRGLELVLALALAAVIARALIAASTGSVWALIPVQVLGGVVIGFAGVTIPTLTARIMEGSGHANAGLGAVMTAYGAGAALSPVITGSVASLTGFPASFSVLAVVATAGLVIWSVRQRLSAAAEPG